ncbi:MAG TPA: sigma-70 family RNA polymerase sigma factor [Kofleriaceae bacterium]|nr:sigma-70 family RNA polymerase sigma factor [Kofleriaceae bacterium]
MTDLDLAQRAANGDRPSQRALFVAQRTGVHRTLYRILGNNRDLEDLVQDAFLEIFRSLRSFRGDSSLARWCQIITTRVAYLAISRRKPPSVDLALVEDELGHDTQPDRVVQARIAAKRLYAALDRLDAKHRVAFALAVIDERPLAEVAALTESSRFAVKTRVWRARRELRIRASKDSVLAAYLVELGGES